MNEIDAFYNSGVEIGRLERGLGKVEFYRTKEILRNYICKKNSVIYDVGGGVGAYSAWLAKMGMKVSLVEPAEVAVAYAKANMKSDCSFDCEVGDARCLSFPDDSADVVLLMGPLYHLRDRKERIKTLAESRRVLKKGGLIVCAGISRYSSATWALSVYGVKNNFIDDDIYFDMLIKEITSGDHIRPKEYPLILPEAYFTTVKEMTLEIGEAGFSVMGFHAVEGCIWMTPCLEEKWTDEKSRERLLELVRMTEHDEEMAGMSPHFLVVARKD